MPGLTKTLSIGGLAAASSNNIATTQAGTANTALTLNGSTVTGGVATLDLPRRVLVTSTGTDTSINFKIVGTDRNGASMTETIKGGSSGNPVYTANDFLTVTAVTPSGNTAANVTVGTNTIASSAPMIVDFFANPNQIGCSIAVVGTANYTIQEALDDLSPAWNIGANTPTWSNDPNFTAQTNNLQGQLSGPFTMIRILINSGAGSGASVTGKFVTPFNAGRIN